MLFNSIEFFYFLPIVLAIYYCLGLRMQNIWLLLASYVFYGFWDPRFLGLLAVSTVVDFYCGVGLSNTDDQRKRRLFLTLSVLTNLGILGFFKYYNFFIDSAATMLSTVGLNPNMPFLSIVLPVGISFYTFQTLSYTIDVYGRKMEPTKNFLSFALFVAYFPQLVAGPIERATRLLPQIQSERHTTGYHILSGVWLIIFGFFKKVAIADAVAPFVDEAFKNPSELGGWALLGATYLFAIQIYGDFSGYTDIARGVSRLMGIELMVNFRQPYLAKNPSEFWRRWHISLSTFLRDYLYIPLGGNRKGEKRTYANLSTTMLLGGLWHGASWNFVVWGGLHGLYLMVHRFFTSGKPDDVRRTKQSLGSTPLQWGLSLVKIVLMFQLVCLTWVFFRAESLGQSIDIVSQILISPMTGDSMNMFRFLIFGGAILLLDVAQEALKTDEPSAVYLPAWLSGILAAILIYCIFIFGGRGSAFIYFQF